MVSPINLIFFGFGFVFSDLEYLNFDCLFFLQVMKLIVESMNVVDRPNETAGYNNYCKETIDITSFNTKVRYESQAQLRHILGIPLVYLVHISSISLEHLRPIFGIYLAYFGPI